MAENGVSDSPAGDGVIGLSDETSYALLMSPEGMVIAANASLARRLGLDPDLILGSCLYDCFPLDVAEFRRSMAQQALKTKQSLQYQDVSRSGSVLETLIQPVLDASGEVSALAVFVSDITSQWHVAQDRLRLASALEQAVEAVIILDNDLNISYVNQAFEDMTGFSQSEVRGRPLGGLYQGPPQQRTYEEIVRTVSEGEAWSGRTFNTIKDGRTIRVEKTVSPIRGRSGVIIGYVSVWRDVTQVAALERQLRQAQKMEAIGTLAGGIAHDFNNILGPIVLYSEMGLDLLPEGSPTHHGLQEILGAANRAKALVEQILSLSRRHEGEGPVPFSLSSIINECVKLLRPSLPATIDIVLDFNPGGDVVSADPTQIHQVLMNLCTNAAYAMREGGGTLTLRLETQVLKDPMKSLFPQLEPGAYVVLSVVDTGHGIPEAQQSQIFDPFFTTKKSGGTGLGLAVVHNIVSRHHGAVHVRSSVKQGTTFSIALPWVDAPGLESSVEPLGAAKGRGERILFVEDETPLREGTSLILRNLGYDVVPCQGGAEALERFRSDPHGYDLVLTDVTMPGMTGVELIHGIRRLHSSVSVVLTSGYTDLVTPDILAALEALFLKKPYHTEGLATLLREALEKQSPSPR